MSSQMRARIISVLAHFLCKPPHHDLKAGAFSCGVKEKPRAYARDFSMVPRKRGQKVIRWCHKWEAAARVYYSSRIGLIPTLLV